MSRTGSSLLVSLVLLGGLVAPLAAQQTGRLRIEAQPTRAGVFVDDEYVGPASKNGNVQTYTVPAGQHRVTLRDSRHADASAMVAVVAGQTTSLGITLEPVDPAQPPFGTLRTQHEDAKAAVYVNGRYMGHVDEFNNFAQGLLLNPGTYDVRIEPRDGPPVEEDVTIQVGQTAIVRD